MAGFLYAIHFTGGLVKVGKAVNVERRIAQHLDRVAVAGLAILESTHCACDGSLTAAERLLIARCAAHARVRRGAEWFVGLDFNLVKSWLAAKPEPTETPANTRTSQQLRAWCSERDRRMSALADEMGVKRQQVWSWVSGVRPIPKRRLRKLKGGVERIERREARDAA